MSQACSPILDIRDVSLARGDRTILESVSWRIEPGQHWAMIGPNGSGKTTLLKVTTGYLWPSSGQVSVLGNKFGTVDLRMLRKKIGWASSALQARMPPGASAKDVVLSGRFASIGLYEEPSVTDASRAEMLLEQMGCQTIKDSSWGVLSLGEQQRVLISRAMMAEPPLLILDEPCAGLDLPGRERLLARIESLITDSNRTTLVFVTHHIEEIVPHITNVLALNAGRVFACGEKEQILTSEILSGTFGLPLEVHTHGKRYWPRA